MLRAWWRGRARGSGGACGLGVGAHGDEDSIAAFFPINPDEKQYLNSANLTHCACGWAIGGGSRLTLPVPNPYLGPSLSLDRCGDVEVMDTAPSLEGDRGRGASKHDGAPPAKHTLPPPSLPAPPQPRHLRAMTSPAPCV